MSATVIDGKRVAGRVRAAVRERVDDFQQQRGRAPGLATVLVGDDPASASYIAGKERACSEAGIRSFHQHLDAKADPAALKEGVASAAASDDVDAILVQLPLPEQHDEQAIARLIPPEKDADGFHPFNVGELVLRGGGVRPPTPAGVVRLLDEYEVPISGAHVVVVGRSNIVGKPLAVMLLERDATVTICHSRTHDVASHTRAASIVVMAVGRPGLLQADMVAPGAAVVDVGVSREADGKLVGDVAYDEVRERAGWITPVPGGVGPMTIAMLLHNTVELAERRAVSSGA